MQMMGGMEQTLFTPPKRTLVHTRRVTCNGYVCSDGTLQVEALMQDITVNGTDLYFKRLDAGEGPIAKPHVVGTCQAYRAEGPALEAIWPVHRRPV